MTICTATVTAALVDIAILTRFKCYILFLETERESSQKASSDGEGEEGWFSPVYQLGCRIEDRHIPRCHLGNCWTMLVY